MSRLDISKFLRMGGPELALELVERFQREAPERLAKARAGYEGGDLMPVEEHCHRLASDAGWLGSREFQKLASRAEILAMEKQVEEVDAALADLESRLPGLLEQLPGIRDALKEGRDPCDST